MEKRLALDRCYVTQFSSRDPAQDEQSVQRACSRDGSSGFSRAALSSLALRGISVVSFLIAGIIVASINPDVLTPFGIELTLESAVVLVLISLAQIFSRLLRLGQGILCPRAAPT